MANTGILNGTLIGVYIGGTKIAYGTSHSIDFSMNTRDTTNKDTVGWSSFATGLRACTIQIEHLFAFDAAYGVSDLFTAFAANTALTVTFSTDETGDNEFSGDFVLTALNVNAGVEENTTYSATFQNVGAVTFPAIV